MVILVGDKYRLGGLKDVITKRLSDDVKDIETNTNIKGQENDILALGEASYIIYDIDQYFNESEEIIEVIKRIQRTNKAKPILYVQSINPKSEIIKMAVSKQIKRFISEGTTLGEQKDQLEKILSGYYEANGREELNSVENEVKEDVKSLNRFVEELYDAKQRENEKEKTIIIHKKTAGEIALDTVGIVIRSIFGIISIALMTIAVITLIYADTRLALFNVLGSILKEVLSMVGLA